MFGISLGLVDVVLMSVQHLKYRKMGTWATLGFICVHEPDMSALLLLQQPNLPYVHLQIIKWRVLDLENSVQKASLVYEVHQNTG